MQENWSLGFSSRFDTNQPIQPQKKARTLEILGMSRGGIGLRSEKNGADQLWIYCTDDLHLFA